MYWLPSRHCNVSQIACDPPPGYVDNATDCDDNNANINPDATEICNGIDDNCNGLIDDADSGIVGQTNWFKDNDGDGFPDGAGKKLAF